MIAHKRPKARLSPIWKIPHDEFQAIVKRCHSLSDILRECGICPKGANHLTLKRRLVEDTIDYSHIQLGRGAHFKRGYKHRPTGLSEQECMEHVFIENHEGGKTTVRRYLRRFKLIPERCRDCGLTKVWNGKPLTLQLEHVDGDSTNDRLENLCWLCANCHSQTETYTGKANKRRATQPAQRLACKAM